MYHSECKSCKDYSPDGLCSSPVLSTPGHQVESVLGIKPSIFKSGSVERKTYCFSFWSFSICRLLCQQTVTWILSSMLFMSQHSESGWCLAVGRRVLKHRSQSSLVLLREQVRSTREFEQTEPNNIIYIIPKCVKIDPSWMINVQYIIFI